MNDNNHKDNHSRKEEQAGIVGTVLVHLVLFLILWCCFVQSETPDEESGVPVMLGQDALAQGSSHRLTPVEVQPVASAVTPAQPEQSVPKEEIISQEEEETVVIEKKKPQPKKEAVKEQPQPKETPVEKPREKTEAEKRAEAERAAADAAAKRIAGAFGKGSSMNSSGNAETGTGKQGSPTGNGDTGKSTGTGGYGEFDLGGRSLGEGGLPKPVYNVQDEGRVVVTITVNPAGQVIATSINKQTNTVNASLRRAAEEAAKKARFNAISGVDNQTGTITYYFNLK